MCTASAESASLDDDDEADPHGDQVDISCASLHELVRAGFSRSYAARITHARQNADWHHKHFFVMKKQKEGSVCYRNISRI